MEDKCESRNKYPSNNPSDYDRYIILEKELNIPASHYTTWHYINLFNLKTNACTNER